MVATIFLNYLPYIFCKILQLSQQKHMSRLVMGDL